VPLSQASYKPQGNGERAAAKLNRSKTQTYHREVRLLPPAVLLGAQFAPRIESQSLQQGSYLKLAQRIFQHGSVGQPAT